MVFTSLLSVGFMQLKTVYEDGFAAARSVEFYDQPAVQRLLWARTLGDTLVILSALIFTTASLKHLHATSKDQSYPNSG